MDFSPFDPLTNLEAVSEVIKTIRHLSWSYAGDIARIVIKIGKTFYAGRCVVCVCTDEGKIEVFEYTDGTVESLQDYFETPEGQKFLSHCSELGPECVQLKPASKAEIKRQSEIEESGGADGMHLFSKEDFPENRSG